MDSSKDSISASKLLYDEPPLQVIPSLATRIGLNEALVVQQLHYWMINPKIGKVIDGKHWIYNTVDQWKENFPFWSRNTIRRILEKLEEKKIIVSGNHNKLTLDHTKWYTLDYEALTAYQRPKKKGKVFNFGKSSSKVGQMDLPKLGNAIPETTTETTKHSLQDVEKSTPADGDVLGKELDSPIQSKALQASKESSAVTKLAEPTESEVATFLQAKALEVPNPPLAPRPPSPPKAKADKKPTERKPSIAQPVNDAVATHIQRIDPKMAVALTGTLAQKAAGVWRRHLSKDKLTVDEYSAVARSIPKFVEWFNKECEGCALPTSPPTFESRYAQFVSATVNGKPSQPQDDYIEIPHPKHPKGSGIYISVLRSSPEAIAYANASRE